MSFPTFTLPKVLASGFILALTCVVFVSMQPSAGAKPQRQTIFARLSLLEASQASAAFEAQQDLAQIQGHTSKIDETIESMSVTRRATGHLQRELVDKQRVWDSWHRQLDQLQLSEKARQVQDLKYLTKHAQEQFYLSQRKRQSILLNLDQDATKLRSLIQEHAVMHVSLAQHRASSQVAKVGYDKEKVSATQAKPHVVQADLAATDEKFSAHLATLKPENPTQDFHRYKGTLVPPVKSSPDVLFGRRPAKKSAHYVRQKGQTYFVPSGTPVYAVSSGRVVHAGFFEGYGRVLILDHGGGYFSVYAHLKDLRVKRDQRLRRSKLLGTSGDTGSLEGEKFYFELRSKSKAVNPADWFVKR